MALDTRKELKITNEKEAFDAILKALNKQLPDDIKLSFDNWPRVTVELEGNGYEATITPSIMKSLVNFQDGLNRSYLKLVHDETSLQRLKDEDKKSLEFKAKVENGCTLLEINLSDFVQKISVDLLGKMDGQQSLILILGLGALWSATVVAKTYFANSSKDKEINEQTKEKIALSQEETKRHEILAKALTSNPQLNYVMSEASNATVGMLKGVGDADSIEINGIKLSNSDAKTISNTKRSESSDVQLNGNYYIQYVDTSNENEVKIRLLSLDTNKEFIAKFKDNTLDQMQISLLKSAEWSRPKEKIYLSINGTMLRGEITTATIISVTQQPNN